MTLKGYRVVPGAPGGGDGEGGGGELVLYEEWLSWREPGSSGHIVLAAVLAVMPVANLALNVAASMAFSAFAAALAAGSFTMS